MRKRFLAFLAVYFFSFLTVAQSIEPPNPSNQLKYSDILPPSPGVASLSTFNRPGVGMSSGAVQYNVPVASLSVGRLTVPVTLNYQSSGLKVDEISSRVGTGWQLEAGGSINRVVMGSADDHSTFRAIPANTSTSSPEFFRFLRDVSRSKTNGGYDAQPDRFNFSFCGRSGSFVLDANDNPYMVPQGNFKILKPNFTNNSLPNFTIIDNEGNKFFFGSTGYVEKSKKDQTCSRLYNMFVATSWLLKSIELQTGQVITFNYSPVEYTYDLGINNNVYWNNPLNSPPPQGCDPCADMNTSVNTCVSKITVQSYYLTSIISEHKQIALDYISRQDCGDVLLKEVTEVDLLNPGKVQKYTFNYTIVHTTQFTNSHSQLLNDQNHYRPFLSSVTKGTAPALVKLYQFNYYNLNDLPIRLAYAQDHWGFYNGQNNASLLPKPADYYTSLKFPGISANRDANPAKAKNGLLSKINFPTGGYDSILYDANTVWLEDVPQYPIESNTHSGTATGTGISGEVEVQIGTMSIGFRQRITVSVTGTNTTGGTPTHHVTGGVRILGPSGQSIALLPGESVMESIDVDPGSYTVKVFAVGAIMQTQASVTFIPGPVTYLDINKPVMGLRVKKISSYSYDDSNSGTRYYTYASRNTPGQSSGRTSIHTPLYTKPIENKNYYSPTPGGLINSAEWLCTHVGLWSSSQVSLFSYGSNPVVYSSVLESDTPDFSNGVVENEFHTVEDGFGSILLGDEFPAGIPFTNHGVVMNGKEKAKTIYRNVAGTLVPAKRTTYTYKVSGPISTFEGCVVNKKFENYVEEVDDTPPTPAWVFDAYEAYRYNINSPWLVMDSTIEEALESNGALQTVTRYKHDNLLSMQPTQIDVKNSQGKNLITKNFYPSDKSLITGLTATELATLDSMVAQNIVSELVSQETYVIQNTIPPTEIFTGRYLVTYSQWNKSPKSFILPSEVKQFNVNGGEPTTFYFEDYDDKGNIRQRRKNGIVVSYLWDYKSTVPVAEAIGTSFSDIAFTSFEADGSGSFSITGGSVSDDPLAPTGKKIYSLGSLSKSSLNSQQNYIVSYWLKGGTVSVSGGSIANLVSIPERDGWTSVSMTVKNASQITIDGTGYLDEVRIFPASAQMTTLSHDPLKGPVSKTDTNSNTKYFEYDALGRLKNVRDIDRYLLSTYRYNYRTNVVE